MTKIEKSVRTSVQVHTGARKNEILRFENGVWHMKIAALPFKSKANKELIEFLSEVLDVSRSSITIEKGQTSHRKLIIIEGLTEIEVTKRLQAS